MSKRIFILGNGAMASALAFGLKDSYELIIVGRSKNKLQALCEQGFATQSYDEFNYDIEDKTIILAFKPYNLKEMASKLKGKAKMLFSVLANTDFIALESIKAQNYIRLMPNTAARYKSSTTPFVCKNDLFDVEIKLLLNSFGKAYELENENLMQAAMAISGCAPAFLALVAESINNAGVYEGLNAKLSAQLTSSLFESFSSLLAHEHPALIKEKICSPAGVTIKGIKALEKHGVRGAFFDAISASAKLV